MRRLFVATLFLSALCAVPANAEDYIDLVRKGNEAFKSGDHKKAMECYHSAETELPESPELEYNMAGALYRDGAYEEATDKYTKAMNTTNIGLEGDAHYNLGNTFFRAEDYENAIKSYQKALEIHSDDIDAKYNLELARRKLKEQIKPQKKKQQQQQQQKQQKQKKQQQEQQKDKQQQKTQDQQQQEEKQDQQQQPQPREKKEISKEDAERILNALKDDEQDIQKKIKRQRATGNYRGKDW